MRFFILFTSFMLVTAAHAENFSPAQEKEIQNIVRDYLVKNPDVLKEAFKALEKQQAEQVGELQQVALKEHADLLFNSKNSAVIGNPNGDVTVVEFFDYNCGYCRAAEADLQKLIAEDPNLRVVLKEYPVLGTGSIEAALIMAQLVNDPKYIELHHVLLSAKGQADKISTLAAAKKLGLDVAKLEDGIQGDAARKPIEESYKLANALGINGTPGYVIGDAVHVGAASYDVLKQNIANMRKCGKAVC
ncbi:MAG: DsbA family protein [Pseudomonadota bacterium]